MNKIMCCLPLAVLLGGCVQEMRIALSDATLASTHHYDLAGLGGWYEGTFRLGQSEVRFHRLSEQGRSGPFVRNRGGSSFIGSGPELGGSASGRCNFDEREVDLGIVALPSERLAYSCRFARAGRDLDGGLFLTEVPFGSGILAGRTRAGEVRLGDLRIDIQPIHHFENGGRPTGSPLGYSFHRDGLQVGAIDLTGRKRIYLPSQEGAERDAVLFGGLALALFWDPAD